MFDWLTRQHIGLLVTVAAAAFLAFSVKVKRQYVGEMADVADRLKGGNLIEPTETYIARRLFWGGLALAAIGALLQW